MSLNTRTTYLNWLIASAVGIALYYRNIGPDRCFGILMLTLSLVYLVEYGITCMLRPETARLLLSAFLVLALVFFVAMTSYQVENASILINIILIISIIYFFWILYSNSSECKTNVNFCSWLKDDEFILGNTMILYLLILMSVWFILGYYYDDWLLILFGLFFLLIIAVVYINYPQYVGYYMVISLTLLMLLYWMLPFFSHDFNIGML